MANEASEVSNVEDFIGGPESWLSKRGFNENSCFRSTFMRKASESLSNPRVLTGSRLVSKDPSSDRSHISYLDSVRSRRGVIQARLNGNGTTVDDEGNNSLLGMTCHIQHAFVPLARLSYYPHQLTFVDAATEHCPVPNEGSHWLRGRSRFRRGFGWRRRGRAFDCSFHAAG